jgi:hypothetical protein
MSRWRFLVVTFPPTFVFMYVHTEKERQGKEKFVCMYAEI